MISWVKVGAALIGIVAITGGVRADIMSVSRGNIEENQAVKTSSKPVNHSIIAPSLFDYESVEDLRLEPVPYSANTEIEHGRVRSLQAPHVLNDGQSSLSLCISAIVGLALCSSAHCVRKLSFGFIPEWYHYGGPFQIGHCFAADPDSICRPVLACCLIPPAITTAGDFLPQYDLGTIVSLWRKSQFTADVLAGRGPPAGR